MLLGNWELDLIYILTHSLLVLHSKSELPLSQNNQLKYWEKWAIPNLLRSTAHAFYQDITRIFDSDYNTFNIVLKIFTCSFWFLFSFVTHLFASLCLDFHGDILL